MIRRAFGGTLGAALMVLALALVSLNDGEVIAQGDPTPSPDLDDALQLARNFSGSNADWTPVIQDFDGVEMVLVPAGCFMMGSENGEDDEKPMHQVCFEEPFWIDRTEVTRAAYMDCVAEGGCEELPAPGYPTTDHQPITQVAWFQAIEYCIWQDARLPTEAEWEYAARGPESWIYPWGNEFVWDNVAWWTDQVAEVGSTPAGRSWVGALDMSGNVSEHVGSVFEDYPYRIDDGREDIFAQGASHAIRGGATRDRSTYDLRAATRFEYARNWSHPTIGFRCARSVETGLALSAISAEPTRAPTPPATPEEGYLSPGSHNADWEPIIQEFDGVEMVLVPAGCFMMGSTDEQVEAAFQQCEVEYGTGNCDRDWFEAEKPAHEVCLDAYWIDRTEVSNGQFEAFNGQAANPSRWTEAERPREQITWGEARDFCESRGARLPTEAEWEYAARGPEGWVYPWGNEWDGARLNYCDVNCYYDWRDSNMDDGYAETAPIGSYPGGASWVGALDLSGNVREFVSSLYQSYPYDAIDGRESNMDISNSRALRGSSWYDTNYNYFRASYRGWNLPYNWFNFDGFRCAHFQ